MLSDWESDLTELSSDLDEEEYVPPTQRKKTTTRNTGSDYKVIHTVILMSFSDLNICPSDHQYSTTTTDDSVHCEESLW